MKSATIVIYTILILTIWILVIGFTVYDLKSHRVEVAEFFTVSQEGVGERCASGSSGCYDFSYVDMTGNIVSGVSAKVLPRYYIDINNTGLLQPVPYGYITDPNDITALIPITNAATYNSDVSGNSQSSTSNVSGIYKNYIANIDGSPAYHDEYVNADGTSNGVVAPDAGGLPAGQMWSKDSSGNITPVSIFDSNYNNPLYYDLKSAPYKSYGPRSYVPTYDDSVYLTSSRQQKRDVAPLAPIRPLSGFCAQYANDHIALEARCNQTDPEVCASLSCCALLGGKKCVAGSKYGPLLHSSYEDRVGDSVTENRDFYYYQGKCYGFCP